MFLPHLALTLRFFSPKMVWLVFTYFSTFLESLNHAISLCLVPSYHLMPEQIIYWNTAFIAALSGPRELNPSHQLSKWALYPLHHYAWAIAPHYLYRFLGLTIDFQYKSLAKLWLAITALTIFLTQTSLKVHYLNKRSYLIIRNWIFVQLIFVLHEKLTIASRCFKNRINFWPKILRSWFFLQKNATADVTWSGFDFPWRSLSSRLMAMAN